MEDPTQEESLSARSHGTVDTRACRSDPKLLFATTRTT